MTLHKNRGGALKHWSEPLLPLPSLLSYSSTLICRPSLPLIDALASILRLCCIFSGMKGQIYA